MLDLLRSKLFHVKVLLKRFHLNVNTTKSRSEKVLKIVCFDINMTLFSLFYRMGAGHINYMELDQLIKLRTGGMGLSTHITTHHSDLNAFEQGLEFSSHCLDRNLPHMFYLWSEIFARFVSLFIVVFYSSFNFLGRLLVVGC